ncbi:MAG: hypothetical protein ACC667_09135, partial [Longimicrobiales bacterium]
MAGLSAQWAGVGATALPGSAGGQLRHEPIFGVGPHTTWRGGWGVEIEAKRQGSETVLPVEVMYGVTEKLTVTAALPWEASSPNSGLGEVGLRAKWRFATRFAPGLSDAVSLVGGITIPRSQAGGAFKGGPGIMLGLAAGRESRRWYYFAGARGTLRVRRDGFDPGDRLALNLAWGVRPRLTAFDVPDLVILMEGNYRAMGRSTLSGEVDRATGSRVLSFGPGILYSIRNIMFKVGLDIPAWDRFNEAGKDASTIVVGAVEFHW